VLADTGTQLPKFEEVSGKTCPARGVGKGWAHKTKRTHHIGWKVEASATITYYACRYRLPELMYSQGTAQKVSETPPARKGGLIQEREMMNKKNY
jgi:hypothetical protein